MGTDVELAESLVVETRNMGTNDTATVIKKQQSESNDIIEEYGPNLKILPTNDQVKELQTILRDK